MTTQTKTEILTLIHSLRRSKFRGSFHLNQNMQNYLELFDGVNQEEVFTTNSYKTQNASDTKYLKNYLTSLKNKILKVYLLEYRANSSNLKKIKSYCNSNGFSYHNAKNKNLD